MATDLHDRSVLPPKDRCGRPQSATVARRTAGVLGHNILSSNPSDIEHALLASLSEQTRELVKGTALPLGDTLALFSDSHPDKLVCQNAKTRQDDAAVPVSGGTLEEGDSLCMFLSSEEDAASDVSSETEPYATERSQSGPPECVARKEPQNKRPQKPQRKAPLVPRCATLKQGPVRVVDPKQRLASAAASGMLNSTTHLVIEVEHCVNCAEHRLTTRHDPQKYAAALLSIEESIAGSVGKLFKTSVVANPIDSLRRGRPPAPRLGAFEIHLCWRHEGKTYTVLLYSKLKNGKFPIGFDLAARLLKDLSCMLESDHGVAPPSPDP